MRKPAICSLMALLILSGLVSYSQVTQQWVQRLGLSGNEHPIAMKTDASGNVYVLGSSNYLTFQDDILLVKYNSLGTLQWVQTYNGGSNAADQPGGLAVDGAGNVYVSINSGYISGSTSTTQIVTRKYSTAGAILWTSYFLRPDLLPAGSNGIAVDASGNVYITGYTIVDALAYDYMTIKYASDGTQLWMNTYNGAANSSDMSLFIALDPAGNVYITGQSIGQQRTKLGIRLTYYDYVTFKYAPDGTQLWRQSYNGSSHHDIPKGLFVDNVGNVYVTGQSDNGTNQDFATVKYSTDGLQQWVVRYNGPANGNDGARGIVADNSGNVTVTGYTDIGGGNYNYATIRYNASGIQQWISQYNGTGNGADVATAIGSDIYGSIYVTGESVGTAGYDYVTVKYSSSGGQLWLQRYNGTAGTADKATALAILNPTGPVAGNASVYVTGGSQGTGEDFTTLKYTQQLIVAGAAVSDVKAEKISNESGAAFFNTPNPFSSSTVISYRLPEDAHVSIALYDVSGRALGLLEQGWKKRGTYTLNYAPGSLVSGHYICRLTVQREGKTQVMNRMLLLQR
ncbi:MAG TPA: SBBP repeat-containing protein [Flavisolibacter sp.]|jgi:hypothetical protein|nr:SBBP repeat-containing protein [Flavisolibacter sp.]